MKPRQIKKGKLKTTESISKWMDGISKIKLDRKISAQEHFDTILPSIDSDCPVCQMKDVKIEQLRRLISGTKTEVEIEAVKNFMREVMINQFYGKAALIAFYRNYIKGLKDGK